MNKIDLFHRVWLQRVCPKIQSQDPLQHLQMQQHAAQHHQTLLPLDLEPGSPCSIFKCSSMKHSNIRLCCFQIQSQDPPVASSNAVACSIAPLGYVTSYFRARTLLQHLQMQQHAAQHQQTMLLLDQEPGPPCSIFKYSSMQHSTIQLYYFQF